jgi:hypothetical protein
MTKDSEIFLYVKKLIVALRRQQNTEANWTLFKNFIENNINIICKEFDTRWLVSIADTYIDHGNAIEKRNAMYISLIANFEKIWATKLLMFDIELNSLKLKRLKQNAIVPLWDGMYSFNINRGDMVNNLFDRLTGIMKETPCLFQIYNTIIAKLIDNKNSTLGTLNIYHKDLLAPPKKRSIFNIFIRKIRFFFKQYRLFSF